MNLTIDNDFCDLSFTKSEYCDDVYWFSLLFLVVENFAKTWGSRESTLAFTGDELSNNANFPFGRGNENDVSSVFKFSSFFTDTVLANLSTVDPTEIYNEVYSLILRCSVLKKLGT